MGIINKQVMFLNKLKKEKFSFRKFFKSFSYAASGIREVFRHEQNFKVHTIAGTLAILLGFLLRLAPWEWCILILVIVTVLAAEMANTAIEKLCDVAEPKQNETIRIVKDVSAGMVLFCAVGALIIGLVLFLPKLITLMQQIV